MWDLVSDENTSHSSAVVCLFTESCPSSTDGSFWDIFQSAKSLPLLETFCTCREMQRSIWTCQVSSKYLLHEHGSMVTPRGSSQCPVQGALTPLTYMLFLWQEAGLHLHHPHTSFSPQKRNKWLSTLWPSILVPLWGKLGKRIYCLFLFLTKADTSEKLLLIWLVGSLLLE